MNSAKHITAASVLISLVACSSAPVTSYHTLIKSAPSAIGEKNGPTVVLVRVDAPESIFSKNINIIDQDGSIKQPPYHKWLSSVGSEIPRLVSMEIGRTLKTDRSIYSPFDHQSIRDATKISLNIESIRLQNGKGAEVSLHYKIIKQELERTGRIVSFEAARSAAIADMVEALHGALKKCAQDLAREIEERGAE